MTLAKARQIGRSCGTQFDYEHVNNVIHHIFNHDTENPELKALIREAKEFGIPFAECGHADKEKGNRICYMCKKIN